jgi:hypothetical protein
VLRKHCGYIVLVPVASCLGARQWMSAAEAGDICSLDAFPVGCHAGGWGRGVCGDDEVLVVRLGL